MFRAQSHAGPRPERPLNFARFPKAQEKSRTWMWVVFFLLVIAAATTYAVMEYYDYEIDFSVLG